MSCASCVRVSLLNALTAGSVNNKLENANPNPDAEEGAEKTNEEAKKESKDIANGKA